MDMESLSPTWAAAQRVGEARVERRARRGRRRRRRPDRARDARPALKVAEAVERDDTGAVWRREAEGEGVEEHDGLRKGRKGVESVFEGW